MPIPEETRKRLLKALEDKRLAFAMKMAERGFSPDRALYIQRDGGFWGLARVGKEACLIYGPGPNDEADFSIETFTPGEYSVEMKDAAVASKGMGGAFGFGTRGGKGFTMTITRPDGTSAELTLLSDIGAFKECKSDGGALFKAKRSRGDANFVWDFRSASFADVRKTGEKWLRLISADGAAD